MNAKLEKMLENTRRRVNELEDDLYGGGLSEEVRQSKFIEYMALSKQYTYMQVFSNMFAGE